LGIRLIDRFIVCRIDTDIVNVKNNYNYIDQIYPFKGFLGIDSKCGLKIIEKKEQVVAIVTELYESNPGSSATESCNTIANNIFNEYSVKPENFVFIIHTPDRKSHLDFYKETFFITHFTWDGEKLTDPKWEEITKERVDNIILNQAANK